MARVASAKNSCCRSGSDAQVNDVLSLPRLMRTPHVGNDDRRDSPIIDAGDAIKNINCNATNALALSHYEAKEDEATAAALACLESRCGLTKSVDDAYDAFDKKEPWDEVLS